MSGFDSHPRDMVYKFWYALTAVVIAATWIHFFVVR